MTIETPVYHHIHLGDTTRALAVTLSRPDGSVVDLTGATLKFKLIAARDGTTKTAETASGVSVTDAVAGEVQYDFAAADVDTAGLYYAYFVVYLSEESEHFPAKTGLLRVSVQADG